MKDVRLRKGDEELQFSKTMEPFFAGQTAMIRNTANICDSIKAERGMNCVILPYFGETSEDNWVLTYPMCQLAVSKKVEENEAKKKAVSEVLMAIFSEEGQKHVAAGTSVLSYNKEVKITPTNALDYVQDCINSNHLYMRLASTEVFGISQDVGHKMMTGEYDANAAYEAFNKQITDYKNPEAEEVLFTQNTAYSNDFGVHGSQAASSLMNTLRYYNDDQIAIGYASVASSPIFVGDYTMQQVKWIMTFRNALYRGEYTVLLFGADTYIEHPTFCNCPMPEDLKAKRADYIVNDFTSQEYIREALTQTQQFLEPTDYVTIVKGY